jgi:hypothetical protein
LAGKPNTCHKVLNLEPMAGLAEVTGAKPNRGVIAGATLLDVSATLCGSVALFLNSNSTFH